MKFDNFYTHCYGRDMRWPWGSEFTTEQRQETAKVFLRVFEVIFIALIACPFIPGIAKRLTMNNTIYGYLLVLILYLSAMRLLRK